MTQASFSTDTELLGLTRVGYWLMVHIYTDGDKASHFPRQLHATYN